MTIRKYHFACFLLFFSFPLFSFGQRPQAQMQQQQQQPQNNSDIIIDWNEVGMVGTCSANGLILPKGNPVPFDYAAPIFSNFGLEVGLRYPIFFDKKSNVSFAAEAPIQVGLISTPGPSQSVPKYSNSLWLAGAAMITMNHGLGASYENSDKDFGAYIGIGIGYNKPCIFEKDYTFNYTTQLQEVLPYRFVGYFTANGMAGIRWRNRNGLTRNLGVEGNYGIYGEAAVGITFGQVIGM